MGIEMKKMWVTPKLARQWLAENKNKNFRKFRASIAGRYASDMINDRWGESAAPIQFDEHGNLIDGQHRLAAILKTDRSIEMFIATGVKDSTVIDIGQARNKADIIRSHLGVANAKDIVALINRLRYMGYLGGTIYHYDALTPGEALGIVENNPILVEIASASYKYRADGFITQAEVGALMYMAFEKGGKAAEAIGTFLEGVASGASLPPRDPRLILRNRIANIEKGGRKNVMMRMHFIIKAFRAFVAGERITHFKKSAGTDVPRL